MSDFFSRLIERTMGYAETVQPLISPVYGGLSNEETVLNIQNEHLAGIEESENINDVKSPLLSDRLAMKCHNLSFPLVGNLSFNLTKKDAPKQVRGMTSPGDSLLNSRVNKPPGKDIGGNYHFTEKEKADKQDAEYPTKKENIAPVDLKNKTIERFSLNLLPEVKSITVNKFADSDFPEDSWEADIKDKRTISKQKRNNKASYHLLPLSFKDRPAFQKIDNIEYKKSDDKNNICSDFKLSQEAPSVKINIGRIEVKAIIQQKTKQPHTLKHEPKLSLDEYLKQRISGKR